MLQFDSFLISKEALARLEDQEALMRHVEEGRTLQEFFGFSNDAAVEFYGAAQSILEQKRFEDAVKAFSFLTMLNPNISDFWKGLGMAQQNSHDFEAAIFSYSMAYTIEGEDISPYMLAAQCFMEIRDVDRAVEVLQLALTYADQNPQEEKCGQLKKDAQAAIKYVKDKHGKR